MIKLIKYLTNLTFGPRRETKTMIIYDCLTEDIYQTPYMEVLYDVDSDYVTVDCSVIQEYLNRVDESVKELNLENYEPFTNQLRIYIQDPINYRKNQIKQNQRIRFLLKFVKLYKKEYNFRWSIKVVQSEVEL